MAENPKPPVALKDADDEAAIEEAGPHGGSGAFDNIVVVPPDPSEPG